MLATCSCMYIVLQLRMISCSVCVRVCVHAMGIKLLCTCTLKFVPAPTCVPASTCVPATPGVVPLAGSQSALVPLTGTQSPVEWQNRTFRT